MGGTCSICHGYGCNSNLTFVEIEGHIVECQPQSDDSPDNGCNDIISTSSLFSCFHCGQFDEKCSDNLVNSTELSYPCSSFKSNDSCYIYFDSDRHVHRGCLSDQDEYSELCQNDDSINCQICQSENCNVESVCYVGDACQYNDIGQQFCYKCSSNEDKNCEFEPYLTENVTCFGVERIEDQGCYTRIVNYILKEATDDYYNFEDKFIDRGCFSDLLRWEQMKCRTGEDDCEICAGEENCNRVPKTSAAVSIIFDKLLMFVVFVLSNLF